jgi:hypothetical protein
MLFYITYPAIRPIRYGPLLVEGIRLVSTVPNMREVVNLLVWEVKSTSMEAVKPEQGVRQQAKRRKRRNPRRSGIPFFVGEGVAIQECM